MKRIRWGVNRGDVARARERGKEGERMSGEEDKREREKQFVGPHMAQVGRWDRTGSNDVRRNVSAGTPAGNDSQVVLKPPYAPWLVPSWHRAADHLTTYVSI